MRRLATTAFTLAALAAAPVAEAQYATDFGPTSSNFSTAGSNERGIAYGNGHVYVTSRQGGTFVYIYDGETGAFLSSAGAGAGSLNTTGIPAGTIHDVDVTDDGHIYACTLTTSQSASAFACYHWATETSAPDVVTVSGLPAEAIRIGDRIHITGSGATGLKLWTATPTTTIRLFQCESSSYTAFSCVTHNANAVGASSISAPSVSPDPRPHTSPDSMYVWLNGNGSLPRLLSIKALGGGTAFRINNIPANRLNEASGTGNSTIRAFQNVAGDSTFVALFEYSGTSYARARIVNVTGLMRGVTMTTLNVYAWGITPSVGANSTGGLGDIALRLNPINPNYGASSADGQQGSRKAAAIRSVNIFVMGSNNGIGSFESSKLSLLPVELVSFAGVASGSTARLSWATASETNNMGFVVERQQGDNWADASGLIAGRGTTTERHDYTFDVVGLAAGRHTFRLRQVDTDGSVHYSSPTTVEIGLETAYAVTLLGQRAVRVSVQEAQAVTVAVYDVLGRAVATLRDGELDGTVEVALPSGLAAGSYLVRVTGERFAATKALVVR